MLDCSFEQILTDDEVLSMLCISQEELMELLSPKELSKLMETWAQYGQR